MDPLRIEDPVLRLVDPVSVDGFEPEGGLRGDAWPADVNTSELTDGADPVDGPGDGPGAPPLLTVLALMAGLALVLTWARARLA